MVSPLNPLASYFLDDAHSDYEEFLSITSIVEKRSATLNPKSLKAICIQIIARYIDKLIEPEVDACTSETNQKDIALTSVHVVGNIHANAASSGSLPSCRCTKSHFKQSTAHLSSMQASMLLAELLQTDGLKNYTVSLFHPCNMHYPTFLSIDWKSVRRFYLEDEPFDWSFLASFPLRSLKLPNFTGVDQLVWELTSPHILHLRIHRTHAFAPVNASLPNFPRNLISLDLSECANVDTELLNSIVNNLHNLKRLNIASTKVQDLSCLARFSHSLESLNVHRLSFPDPSTGFQLIQKELQNLRELYFSWSPEGFFNIRDIPHHQLLQDFISLGSHPRLQLLDLSGNRLALTSEQLRLFLTNHPHLKALAISSWIHPRQNMDRMLEIIYKDFSHLKIAGDSKETLIETLLWHEKQPALLLPALHMVFDLTQNEETEDLLLLQQVLRCMGRFTNAKQPNLILAATAVVYNLTRGLQARKHPQYILNWAVNATMQAIEYHIDHRQMLKNCFLTLCTDYVLHNAEFSHFRCCQLVFAGLLRQDDNHLKRMGVAILSILAAELNQQELRQLTTKENKHFEKLLVFVAEKCLTNDDVSQCGNRALQAIATPNRVFQAPQYDLILRFTLSALWNFTDECMEACFVFIHSDGLYVYEKVFENMKNFDLDSKIDVYTKCLGLLNNIAEFDQCRPFLFRPGMMRIFHELLTVEVIQSRYFAAGILAHLALNVEDWKKVPEFRREKSLSDLVETVLQWQNPDVDMVAYRSFRPFERLATDARSSEAAQTWVLWAIYHVMSRRTNRYAPLLLSCPQLCEYIRTMAASKPSAPYQEKMASLAKKILDLCASAPVPENIATAS